MNPKFGRHFNEYIDNLIEHQKDYYGTGALQGIGMTKMLIDKYESTAREDSAPAQNNQAPAQPEETPAQAPAQPEETPPASGTGRRIRWQQE